MFFGDDRNVNVNKVNENVITTTTTTSNSSNNNNVANNKVNTGTCVASPLDELFGFSPTTTSSLSSPLDDLFDTSHHYTQRQV